MPLIKCSRKECFFMASMGVFINKFSASMAWQQVIDAVFYIGFALTLHWFFNEGWPMIKAWIHRVTA